MRSKVAVIKTKPNSVLDDYGKVMRLVGYKEVLNKKRKTLVKLNLSWSLFYPACSTPPWQLDGVLKELEGYDLMAVENKTVVTDVMKGLKNNKWESVLDKYKVPFASLPQVKWSVYKPKHKMIAIPKIFPDGLKIPDIFHGRDMIHLPTMKTHGHTTMTGAMKNAFGGLITERRHHSHKMIHEVLVDLLQIQKEIHPNLFAVMDGAVCGDGAGPRTMVPVEKNFLLASSDQVAIDTISARMMGFDPMEIPFIKIAHRRKLGVGNPDKIKIIGEDISEVNFGFTTGKSPVIMGDQLFRKGALRFVEPFLFHTGLFKACVFGSAFYHDSIWYPTVGKKRIAEFMKSKWGELFKSYKTK
jgi:uncharacterized protein (DUF362 family)